jgi:hypothetical protein
LFAEMDQDDPSEDAPPLPASMPASLPDAAAPVAAPAPTGDDDLGPTALMRRLGLAPGETLDWAAFARRTGRDESGGGD